MTLTALARACFPALLLLAAVAAPAQGLYRQVDPSGRVTYSDRPAAAGTQPGAAGGTARSAGAANPILPYELRQVVQRYPVVLYTGDDCAPCATGRSLLLTRGIPFDERTVTTPQDIVALERLTGQKSLPVLTIGTQQIKGFSDEEWSRYLDAAGYPKSVQLPAGFQNPPARPLVAAQSVAPAAPAAPAAAAPAPAAPPPPPASGPTPSNPAGIRF